MKDKIIVCLNTYISNILSGKNERKSQKLEDFFLNEQEQGNLVVAKNKSLKSEIHSSEKKNLSNSGYSKLIQVPHSQYNLNSTTTYAFQDKSKFSQHIFKYNIFDNILSNQTFKDNPTHFETSNSKSLLKMLMVGPNISPSKFTDINWRNKKNINNKKEMHH